MTLATDPIVTAPGPAGPEHFRRGRAVPMRDIARRLMMSDLAGGAREEGRDDVVACRSSDWRPRS
jgi:hypothetical protein